MHLRSPSPGCHCPACSVGTFGFIWRRRSRPEFDWLVVLSVTRPRPLGVVSARHALDLAHTQPELPARLLLSQPLPVLLLDDPQPIDLLTA